MTPNEHKAFFDEQGYLIIEGLLSQDLLRRCREEINRLHSLAVQFEAQRDTDFDNFQREPFAESAVREDGLPSLRKIERTDKYSELFADLSKEPRLIATLQHLLCEDLLLFRSTLMLKPAFHGSAHGYHQDSAYWPIDPPQSITVSIALNEATVENGCIKVIPGSHRWKLLPNPGRIWRKDGESIGEEEIDASNAINVPLKAGDALIFHSLCMHGSGPNHSPQPRHTALYAYFSPHVRLIPVEGLEIETTYTVAAGLNGVPTYTFDSASVGTK